MATIGELEKAAGVTDREAFWRPFAKHADGFDRGVAELNARIRTARGEKPARRKPYKKNKDRS